MDFHPSNLKACCTVNAPHRCHNLVAEANWPTDSHRQSMSKRLQSTSLVIIRRSKGLVDGIVQHVFEVGSSGSQRDVGMSDGDGCVWPHFYSTIYRDLLHECSGIVYRDAQVDVLCLMNERGE